VTWPTTFDSNRLNLCTDRVTPMDGRRQMETVCEVLHRFESQPGLVLADEVGMGKTFVALSVAIFAAVADKGKRPVVIMVPPSLREKWPHDWEVFKELCLKNHPEGQSLKEGRAHTGLDFFRLLDDPPGKRARIIFLTHGAFQVGLTDPWVKLAIIRAALRGIHLGARRQALPRFVADLIRSKSKIDDPDLYARLLAVSCSRWKEIINECAREKDRLCDDPVPEAVDKVLERGEVDLTFLANSLRELPARESAYLDQRLEAIREQLNKAMRSIWPQALVQAHFRSPLLVLDEAHHLKNPATRLASLFVDSNVEEETKNMLAGALSGGFERMLFMTATPFQLGHHELLHILERFDAIAWDSLPSMSRETFAEQLKKLETALDNAQRSTTDLDQQWRSIRWEDVPGGSHVGVDSWWNGLSSAGDLPERIQVVRRSYERALNTMKEAGRCLLPWVIRHLRSRQLTPDTPRRLRLDGKAIKTGDIHEREGIAVADDAVLPFLLAARSQALVARSQGETKGTGRATFAEGLASSYEAFLETRQKGGAPAGSVDEEEAGQFNEDARLERYLERLDEALPSNLARGRHPKVLALVERVGSLWEEGEKVVVFCHYQATGRALARHISADIDRRLHHRVCKSVGCSEEKARDLVRKSGEAFVRGRPLERTLRKVMMDLLANHAAIDEKTRDRVVEVVRRFVRTPPFLARYLDLGKPDREEAMDAAFDSADGSGLTLRHKLKDFVDFIADRCQTNERNDYLEALESISPGARGEKPKDSSDMDESRGIRLPNVRLANGPVKPATRRRLLLGFNSPFFPEVLVASSVMAEGVDLHLNCRYIIHHDLSWNPSTVEQRTGRVDRMGAKAERAGKSIHVYWPYVAGTQDEKLFRVVRDRERWFQVVMGEEYKTDELSTDRLADRVPLPEQAAAALAFRLEVFGRREDGC
jgi:Helicase conserved C-terminal domain